MSESKPTDFRYATGPSRVPWAAVGEACGGEDIMRIVETLVRPAADQEAYNEKLAAVQAALCQLISVGKLATKLSLGDTVAKLEAEVKKYLGCKYACFVTNATAGFEIAEQFANIGPGDEVIVPPITFIATAAYPLQRGAKVVFADVDPRTVNMDPADVARKITDKTRMIIPVHIGGYPVDMDPIMELANANDIMVLEDAAHGFGGIYHGRRLGTIGHFGSFSFHEVKNITAVGEGGVLVTDCDAYGEQFGRARFLGLNLGKKIPNWLYDVDPLYGKYGPIAPGNHSSTEIQAAVLLSQIARLDAIIDVRRKATDYMNERLGQVEGIITPLSDSEGITPTHHLYLLQIDPEIVGADVQALRAKLKDKGVTEIPHFAPLYHFNIFKELGYCKDEIAATCPVTEEVFNRRFTHLPLYPLTWEQIETMADLVIEAVEELKAGK